MSRVWRVREFCLDVEQSVSAFRAMEDFGFYLDGRQTELTKTALMNPVTIVQGTPCLPTSKLKHAPEFCPFHLLQFST